MEPVTTDEVQHIPIDYWRIRKGIETSIRSYASLDQIPVHHEFSGEPATESLPCVMIFLTERQTLPEQQRTSAGLRTDFRLVFSVWVLAYSLASMQEAVRQRDEIVAKVDLALMRDRKLGGLLTRSLMIEGGLVESGAAENRTMFASSIETRVIVEVFTSL